MKRNLIAGLALALTVAACGSDSTELPTSASVTFSAQTSDGTSIVVDSVSLPAAGFIAVHANADGSPGAVIGHSDLLPAGTSTDVVVTLDQALTATDLVFPMAHLDIDDDGEYTFAPRDNAVDTRATTEEGSVAVVGAEVTVGS